MGVVVLHVQIKVSVMEIIGLISKLLFFSFWPVLLMFVYYLFDKEDFNKRWQQLKDNIKNLK
ncbi:hypothetical protein DOJK_01817 [Patescibacteria group bacterium]|nr:hypothetical protein DOJK_01817 [Patescibacteria group bacterium]